MSDADIARVQGLLDEVSPGSRITIHPVGTETAESAAAAVGCKVAQIVKSLLFIAADRPVLLLVAGDRKADTAKLAPLLGVPRKRIRMASPAEVQQITGFDVGGVPPLGHPARIETIVDATLARFGEVWAAGGRGNAVFPIRYETLLSATGGRAADVTS